MNDLTLEFLQAKIADNLWMRRGCIENEDKVRIDTDWLDARRLLGYEIMDKLIERCNEGENGNDKKCDHMTDRYLLTLCSISVEEFKKIKAYFIWKKKLKKTVTENETKSIYFEACKQLEKCKKTYSDYKEKDLPKDICTFIIKSNTNFHDKIVMRKVHWLNLNEGKYRSYSENLDKSEEYVNAIYNNPLFDNKVITNSDEEEINKIAKKIENGMSLTNLFEYCLRCHLLRLSNYIKSN